METKTREQELFEHIHRGNDAKQLLENPLLKDAFISVRESIHQKWSESPARDTEGREKLWQMLSLLKMLENHIKGFIETGEQSDIIMKDESKRRKLFSNPF